MLRSISLLFVLSLLLGASEIAAQTKWPASPARGAPTLKDSSITVNVFMKDNNKQELLLATRIWPGYPDYNNIALQRFFMVMKALEPAYKRDDEVAYTWGTKGRVSKCSIYLESWEAAAKTGTTGTMVGCEANAVSTIAATSAADPKHPVSSSGDPKHLDDVMELFKRQSERAKGTLAKQ